jgi:hypothetical protein
MHQIRHEARIHEARIHPGSPDVSDNEIDVLKTVPAGYIRVILQALCGAPYSSPAAAEPDRRQAGNPLRGFAAGRKPDPDRDQEQIVYDMYPWDGASAGGRTQEPPQTPPFWGEPSPQAPRPSLRGDSRARLTPLAPGHGDSLSRRASLTLQQEAVQFALDRRDNGGDVLDAFCAPGQPPAGPGRQ